jgi:hypothetical protein
MPAALVPIISMVNDMLGCVVSDVVVVKGLRGKVVVYGRPYSSVSSNLVLAPSLYFPPLCPKIPSVFLPLCPLTLRALTSGTTNQF